MNDLLKKALEAKANSYSPYSNFKVGAAVRAGSGKVYCGANVENSAYGATICAEQAAISSAIASGERSIEEIAIAGSSEGFTFPCGICRQTMNEFMEPDADIWLLGPDGEKTVYKMKELLPEGFKLKEKE